MLYVEVKALVALGDRWSQDAQGSGKDVESSVSVPKGVKSSRDRGNFAFSSPSDFSSTI